MSTVEGTLVVGRKEVTCKDEDAYHFFFFFLGTSFFFFNKLLLSSRPALLTFCCDFALLDFGVSVPPKHLI